ncbi:uracil-DNA glycosylase family protein [Desulfatitalea alkaliphila]|uniref:Single-stranded DNA-binding protein n=1 Tax=Desulfatitalea alkaliphila TaxID=2929485 RepID=A0AA41UK35_9BACT|nr:uracil-DNA glycosylase family protein [Desulfatitalea alkaliphila]MCJ8501057.1 single-stranded DNA-binding protein [Desulfatitalea alkaliphila]
MRPDTMATIIDRLTARLAPLRFAPPVHSVYNPLTYAREAHLAYAARYAGEGREVLLLGMNPGPWGMAQTGIPFGDVEMVTRWLDIRAAVGQPARPHPKRPIEGFACRRGEVSGQRLWGWAKSRFGTPERFFGRFWVANYCPLVFMEESGRNRTPDKLPPAEREPLLAACDAALAETVALFKPRRVVGVGAFAAQQAAKALAHLNLPVGRIAHPSPANPKANAGWADLIEKELAAMGVVLG